MIAWTYYEYTSRARYPRWTVFHDLLVTQTLIDSSSNYSKWGPLAGEAYKLRNDGVTLIQGLEDLALLVDSFTLRRKVDGDSGIMVILGSAVEQ